ncbi:hypothetical protein SAMN05192544_1001296 [Paraburkholderia hospita]|uniref:Uncharacterized protein n=1 Tax=Paraburkholderia hospita TaxID=169430 RepID=A0AAN1J4G2_9BURK|nr:hypothetical protein C2L64_00775 [Paraburkholderia hospita]SEH41049.1 hypothetical protein SAMN05192544_1001296 [Paraburkholderia hospita]
MNSLPISDDFPKGLSLGSVPGAQPKLLLHKTDGAYSMGPTDVAVYERHVLCEDLARQLATYTSKKMTENTWCLHMAVSKVEAGLLKKVRNGIWEFSDAEIVWTIGRLRQILSAPQATGKALPRSQIFPSQAGEGNHDK